MEEPRKRKKKRTVHEAELNDTEQQKMPRVEDTTEYVPYPPQLDAAQLPEQQAAQNLYLQRVAQIHGGDNSKSEGFGI